MQGLGRNCLQTGQLVKFIGEPGPELVTLEVSRVRPRKRGESNTIARGTAISG